MSVKKDHILLVDDEKHLLISLRDYLVFEMFDVTTAQSGEEALELLEQVTPDVIVLDISMPGMGGMGFLKRISSPSGKPRYPVLVLTARSMLADFFREVAVDGFVAKPCEEAELTALLRTIIAKHRNASEKQSRDRSKVLVGEDDGLLARRQVDALKEAGFDVILAGSGTEVLDKAVAEKPDVILLKEILPQMNGAAVASLLDVMPSTSAIPIIMHDDSRGVVEQDSVRPAARNIRRSYRMSDPAELVKAVTEVCAAP